MPSKTVLEQLFKALPEGTLTPVPFHAPIHSLVEGAAWSWNRPVGRGAQAHRGHRCANQNQNRNPLPPPRVGTTDQGKGKGRSVVRPMGTAAYRGKGQGKGKGRGEGRLGQGRRGRSKGGEKPMGTTADGGKGSKGRAANGDRPVGAASCRRDHHTHGVMPNPPPPPDPQAAHTNGMALDAGCTTRYLSGS